MILRVRLLVQSGRKQRNVSIKRSQKWYLSLAKSEKRKEPVVFFPSLSAPPQKLVPPPPVLQCFTISHR